ncbi:MAG: type II toxin-antitoxin system RelE/ParE family toxin [Chloroflexi bacterium]|nr:type II toxin-antitoxin system RelE/ParE family toxin [Chloroflexota bacterium]
MAYSVVFLLSAARELASLPKDAQRRIARRLDSLAENPRPPGAQALQGSERMLRLRVGDYRVLYQVEDAVREVLVAKVGHRREVYRRT